VTSTEGFARSENWFVEKREARLQKRMPV